MPAYSILLYLHCQIQNMNEMKNDLSGITVFVSILSLIISCITLKEFKEYILELRSLSATTGLGTDICLELEKKYL